jgi:hypothetical protein
MGGRRLLEIDFASQNGKMGAIADGHDKVSQ